MTLALELDSTDSLDEAQKGLYTEKDGKFFLDVSGLPDVSGLKDKNDQLLGELKTFKTKATDAETAAATAKQEALKKSGDWDAYEASLKEKHKTDMSGITSQLDQMKATVTGLTSGGEAVKIATEIAVAGSAEALLPHLQVRLKTDFIDGIPKTIVMDKQGKPSAATIADLTQEFKDNPVFAPLIVGSKASGAGLQAGKEGGRAPDNPWSRKTRNLTEQARIMRESPDLAATLKSQAEA